MDKRDLEEEKQKLMTEITSFANICVNKFAKKTGYAPSHIVIEFGKINKNRIVIKELPDKIKAEETENDIYFKGFKKS